MTAISKAWVVVADAAVDPDSPLDTVLMTALRDRDIFLYEWLGLSFAAGAVQNHRHDGVDSALVPVGPNALRNGSFEDGVDGWTFTDFTGGSHAISALNHRHGALALEITSTVLANGGGDAIANEYSLISEADLLALKFWMWASIAGVSSKLEVVWYDSTKAQISVSVVQSYTDMPTAATFHRAAVTAPANARFYRVKITGGVPGSGTATGTIRFDGIEAGSTGIIQTMILSGAVGQAQLKTATASGSVTVVSVNSFTLTGGTYSIWTASAEEGANGSGMLFGNGDTAAGVIGLHNNSVDAKLFYVDERYVQACPPYNLGNGDIPLFAMALVARDGSLRGVSVALDPVWAYNGPTDIRPERIEGGKAYRRYPLLEDLELHQALKIAAVRERFIKGESPLLMVEREITHAVKNADMALHPHPWAQGNDLAGLTPVMLDPFSPLVDRLRLILEHQGAHEVRDLILAGRLTIGNVPLALTAPPGVMPVTASWKLTA